MIGRNGSLRHAVHDGSCRCFFLVGVDEQSIGFSSRRPLRKGRVEESDLEVRKTTYSGGLYGSATIGRGL